MSNEAVGTGLQTRFKQNISLWKRSFGRYWQLYLLLIPVIANYIIFHYVPMYGIQIAFKSFSLMDGIIGSSWIGFDHFMRFFGAHNFWSIIFNTLILSLLSIGIGFPFAIMLALILNEIRSKRISEGLQVIFVAPNFISTVVVVGMLIAFTSPSNGIVNILLTRLGIIEQGIYFSRLEEWFRPLHVITGLWANTGWSSIIFLAALSTIDTELYEAASIDGASRFKQLIYITLPALMPTIMIQLILRAGRVMNVGFERVLLMQNPGNIMVSRIISTFVYERGIQQQQYDFATAVGLFNSVINLILLLYINRMARKCSQASLW
jgi:putative aldouronate transport system permease protein